MVQQWIDAAVGCFPAELLLLVKGTSKADGADANRILTSGKEYTCIICSLHCHTQDEWFKMLSSSPFLNWLWLGAKKEISRPGSELNGTQISRSRSKGGKRNI